MQKDIQIKINIKINNVISNILMQIEIINVLTKKKKDFSDIIKIGLFGYFTMMLIMYLGHIKPMDSDE